MGRNPCFLAEIGGIMRYIRTKDGVFESKATERGKFIHIPTNDAVAQMHRDNWVWVLEENIVAQADTIEELCDEFVLKATINEQVEYLYDEILKIIEICKIAHEGTGHYCEVYGAIWTEKGLIYKAKMNEKGEFELL